MRSHLEFIASRVRGRLHTPRPESSKSHERQSASGAIARRPPDRDASRCQRRLRGAVVDHGSENLGVGMEIPKEIDYPEAADHNLAESALPLDPQASVNHHFKSVATDWERVYHQATVYGRIYQDRTAISLEWIEQLRLPGMAHLLEIGCGAGFATAALAVRGYRVDALDSVPTMLKLAGKRLAETGTAERVRLVRGDVRHLPMADNSFDLVFALGVLPWLDDTLAAVREMVRVTRPGGYVLLTVDNTVHLEEILDPTRVPIFRPIRRSMVAALRRARLLSPGPQFPRTHRHSRRKFDAILSYAGLDKLRSVMLGFGPFTFFHMTLPDSIGIKVHGLLQAAANRGLPIVSSYGMQYLVMSRKPARVH